MDNDSRAASHFWGGLGSLARAVGLSRLRRLFWLSRLAPRPTPYYPGFYIQRDSVIDRTCDAVLRIGEDRRAEEWFHCIEGILRECRWLHHLDERVVEYPWTLANLRSGRRLLDVGCVLNRAATLHHLRGMFQELHFLNLFYEPLADQTGQLFYHCYDIRKTELPSDHFDAVTCLSTLEHVGADNSYYAGGESRASQSPELPSQADDHCRALAEMCRITKPGGQVLISVPFGIDPDIPGLPTFSTEERGSILAFLQGQQLRIDEAFFRLSDCSWRRATVDDCVDATYQQDTPAATAIWCLCVTKPSSGVPR